MPLFTSSSEAVSHDALERPVPALGTGATVAAAAIVFAVALGAWEWHWRAFGSEPSYQNSDGLWAMQRRRIDREEGDRLVLIGSSRILFDVQLDVWERLSGSRPIQLSVEGTSPMFALEDLADDPDFRGRLLVGVTPPVFFTGSTYRTTLLKHYRTETPSQRTGQWLSMHLIEPFFGFFDPDFALMAVLKRQAWPSRSGVFVYTDVRKLSVMKADRHTWLWSKLETDAAYRAHAQSIWAQIFQGPPPGMSGPDDVRRLVEAQMSRAAAAVGKLRARGVDVIFVRPPSDGAFLEFENKAFPRARTWDVLLQRTGTPGIHFEDHPEMRGLELPEWSHLTRADAVQYTEALYRVVEGIWARGAERRTEAKE